MNRLEVYSMIEKYYRENYETLVKRYSRYVNSPSRAEDIVQEAFCRLLNYWERCPTNEEEFNKYVRTVLNNASKDNSRDEHFKGMSNSKEVEDEQEGPAIPKIILEKVMNKIENSEYHKVKNTPLILKLFFLEQYKAADISDLVPESVAMIRRIVHEFRKDVRKEFLWSI